MKSYLRVVLSALLIFAVAGCAAGTSANSAATAQNAAKITKGMTEAQVKAVLGEPTQVFSNTAAIGANSNLTFTVWTYQGANKVEIAFTNGAVAGMKVDDKQTVGP